jgi:hypothetical protein
LVKVAPAELVNIENDSLLELLVKVVALGAEAVVVLGQLLKLLAVLGAIDGLHDLEGVPVERLARGAREGSLSSDSAVAAVEDSGSVGDAKRRR